MLPGKLVFPNPKDTPPCPAQRPRHQPVARPVARQLPPPERAIVLRLGRVLGAAVPETTVHKYHRPLFSENEVGADGELRVEC